MSTERKLISWTDQNGTPQTGDLGAYAAYLQRFITPYSLRELEIILESVELMTHTYPSTENVLFRDLLSQRINTLMLMQVREQNVLRDLEIEREMGLQHQIDSWEMQREMDAGY